jgi:uncharacterized cupin superfamily protein
MQLRRASDRYVSTQPGITSYHCFAAGSHYDAGNVSFGAVVGVDEHVVAPAAGFERHAHRGVTIVSWVLDGALRHEDDAVERLVLPGELFVQVTADGTFHTERNASDSEALRFVQTTLLGTQPDAVQVATTDAEVLGHAYVARGAWLLGEEPLGPGDSLRTDAPALLRGHGELIVCETRG